jgi:3',5'-nucleoside bisphosphate phosphatase
MKVRKILSMNKKDWHMHTIASDGEQTAARIIEMAFQCHMESISITDHDALDAHRHLAGEQTEKLEVVTGVELDCSYEKSNIEILGYGFNLDDPGLNSYLARVQHERRVRAERYVAKLRERFGQDSLVDEEVFAPGRVTILKPHVIRPLLERGLFKNYGEAKRFMATVPDEGFARATAAEAIEMFKKAGGIAVLAHPGVYDISREFMRSMIRELKSKGLDGIETWYPYHSHQPEKYPGPEAERAFIEVIEKLAADLTLQCTRGGDSHREEEFLEFNRESGTDSPINN